ncbi:MAG: binding-protein-dependent transport system inner rane component [Bacilli bacterium]|nr:binding-protein-dependent transport system inner rane component [Bacilli bacterium]
MRSIVPINRDTITSFNYRKLLRRLRYIFIGKEVDSGLVFRLFMYVILLDISFIYLKPMIYMLTTMVKSFSDLTDPAVDVVPRSIYLGTLQGAWATLKYPTSFVYSLSIAVLVAVLQIFSCAVAGYAFARLEFPLKKFWYFCLLLVFIVPQQVIILPELLFYNKVLMIGQVPFPLLKTLPIIVPALFGHGLRGALFVIIFRQFFSTQPKEMEEAAKIDGASVFRTFYRVMFPLATPAILVVFLFSFVWSWNDFYLPNMFLNGAKQVPLSMGMLSIESYLSAQAADTGPSVFDDPLRMSASFLMIVPPLLLYIFAQRWFVESVERTGLVE